jgi:coenzyme F420 biosynthesis associated uncharacterized protein
LGKSMAELISWETATDVATRVARHRETMTPYERQLLEVEFNELTAEAEGLVTAETGLRSLAGRARARVADRPQWVQANVASFQRLLRPVTDKVGAQMDRNGAWTLLPASLSRQITGAQIGLLLGWMSTRVLGQYDQLLIEDESPEEQDIVYYVGPNVLSVERRYGFPSREFRLWLALHEVTHRAQFTGVPWMRDHFLGLVERTLAGVDPDPRVFLAALRRSLDEIRAGRNPLEEGGLLTLIAGPEQHAAIQEIGGLMSLLEGHGDITMDRAGADRIPNAPWFGQVLKERRRQRGLAKVVSVLVGLDAKMQQYEQGERFIEAVEQAGGPDLLAKVWDGPEWLPTWSEIRAPETWIARAGAASTAVIAPANGSGSVSLG